MEFEVRTVGSIENCFVSLPLSLIHTLQSTAASGFLPPVLPLELRSVSNDTQLWNVSWSGSASSSSAIEVSLFILLFLCLSIIIAKAIAFDYFNL